MAELFTLVPVTYILLVLLIGIPAIVKFIEWCKSTWEKRNKFKQEAINQGINIEKNEESAEHRMRLLETKVELLEANLTKLSNILEKQQKMIQNLIVSDMLDIKAWIKMQHDLWMPRGWIDGQTQDLLSQRYEIYKEEGGNSWAKKLVDDLLALSTTSPVEIIPVPPSYICNTHVQG